jgi:hypothetical protein
MEANAALRTIVRRDSGEGYREMLTRMARESGIETPAAEDLVRLDRNRKGKKLSNADWQSPTDPDARIARLKDGRTHLAYKPEHAMDLDTGAVVTAAVHAADQGDTATMPDTLANAIEHLSSPGEFSPNLAIENRALRCAGGLIRGFESGDEMYRPTSDHLAPEGSGEVGGGPVWGADRDPGAAPAWHECVCNCPTHRTEPRYGSQIHHTRH